MPPTSGMGSIHYPPYAPPPAYTYPQAPQGGDFDDPRFAPPGTAPGGTVTFAPPTQWGPAPAAMASGGAERSLAAFAAESAYRANLSAERLRADMLSLGCGIASDLALRASTTAASEDLSSTEDGPPATPRSVVVRKAVNSKYEKMYCGDLNDKRNGKRYRAIHQLLRKQYGEAVRKFGYDLDEWACIADAEKTHNNDGDDDA